MTNQQEGLMSLKDCASLYSVSLGTINNWLKEMKTFLNLLQFPIQSGFYFPNRKYMIISKCF